MRSDKKLNFVEVRATVSTCHAVTENGNARNDLAIKSL